VLSEPFPEPPRVHEHAEGSGSTIPVASINSATGKAASSATGEKNPLPEPFPEPVEGNGSGNNKKPKNP
jgi:hypothetical protein